MRSERIRLLFLDFDGVLHPTSGAEAIRLCRAELLAESLGGAGCDIVISSSWRHYHDLPTLLGHLPRRLADRVVGSTGQAYVGRWARYNEAVAYVRDHGGMADWRALDDSLFEFPPNCPVLIACDPKTGFGMRQRRMISDWLNA